MFTVSLFKHRCHMWSLVTGLHACHNEYDGWECDKQASEKRGTPASDNKVCVDLSPKVLHVREWDRDGGMFIC